MQADGLMQVSVSLRHKQLAVEQQVALMHQQISMCQAQCMKVHLRNESLLAILDGTKAEVSSH